MSGFPMNVVEVLAQEIRSYLPDHTVVSRPLRSADPARSVGVYAVDVTPDHPNSLFIGQREPAINRYLYRIQNLVKASDEVTGREMFTVDSKTIRVILYRDEQLLVRLQTLSEELFGTREAFKKFGVSRQRFLNNDLRGSFIYLAQTDVWAETDLVKL